MKIWIFKTLLSDAEEMNPDLRPAVAEFISRPGHEILAFSSNGVSHKELWKRPLFRLDRGMKTDFPHTHDAMPLVSAKAKRCIEELVADYVEFLPVDFDAGEYFVMNCTHIIDALDTKRSVISYSRFGNGKISSIEKYVFDLSVIGNSPIFRIPQQKSTTLYVSEEFVKTIEQFHLTGFYPISVCM